MLVDLVAATTNDGVRLNGAYLKPQGDRRSEIDAVLWLHGDTLNFYFEMNLAVGRAVADAGVAFLSANRRGHDIVARGKLGGPMLGTAFDSLADAPSDIEAWLDFLRRRGHRRIALAGHSGGAVRAAYAVAHRQFEDVSGLALISPPEFDFGVMSAAFGDSFLDAYALAERAVADGEGDRLFVPGVPLATSWSAAAYVDWFNRDSRYSVSANAPAAQLPTLHTVGGRDMEICRVAFERISEKGPSQLDAREIDDANHAYSEHGLELSELFVASLGGLAVGDSA